MNTLNLLNRRLLLLVLAAVVAVTVVAYPLFAYSFANPVASVSEQMAGPLIGGGGGGGGNGGCC